MAKKESSEVRQVLLILANAGKKKSWRDLNSVYRDALNSLIVAGVKFLPDDFKEVYARFGGEHWFGGGEGFYATACEKDNLSACRSFEAWKGRLPFMCNGCRLYVGAKFPVPEEHHLYATVNSFHESGECLNATYKDREGKERRLQLTPEEVRKGTRKDKPKQPVEMRRFADEFFKDRGYLDRERWEYRKCMTFKEAYDRLILGNWRNCRVETLLRFLKAQLPYAVVQESLQSEENTRRLIDFDRDIAPLLERFQAKRTRRERD